MVHRVGDRRDDVVGDVEGPASSRPFATIAAVRLSIA
jgi:hypothetical protein